MTATAITTATAYHSLFTTRDEAIEFENQALSIGREFLPEVAIEVLDTVASDHEAPATYWQWLASQIDA